MSEKSRDPRNPYDLHDFLAGLDQALDTARSDYVENYTPPERKPGNPGAVGEVVVTADEWVDDMLTGAAAKKAKWKRKALAPSANPIQAAIDANEKRKDRLAEAEKKEKWLKKMKRLKVDDYFDGVEATDEGLFAERMEAKKAKITKRIGELQPLVKTLKTEIKKMPDKTDSDREKRMLAARKGMIAIGDKLAGA